MHKQHEEIFINLKLLFLNRDIQFNKLHFALFKKTNTSIGFLKKTFSLILKDLRLSVKNNVSHAKQTDAVLYSRHVSYQNSLFKNSAKDLLYLIFEIHNPKKYKKENTKN